MQHWAPVVQTNRCHPALTGLSSELPVDCLHVVTLRIINGSSRSYSLTSGDKISRTAGSCSSFFLMWLILSVPQGATGGWYIFFPLLSLWNIDMVFLCEVWWWPQGTHGNKMTPWVRFIYLTLQVTNFYIMATYTMKYICNTCAEILHCLGLVLICRYSYTETKHRYREGTKKSRWLCCLQIWSSHP